MKRSGFADLPLHGGRVHPWLADRMTKLGTAIVENILLHYGRSELLTRLSDPYCFQALGCVMGMDWHSSGITTSVLGALKRGLSPLQKELGIHVCGGRGKHSRQTPQELVAIGERVGLDGSALATASRLVAKVDSAALQDGFNLYLHGFIVTDDGQWVVVQQGKNGARKQARRSVRLMISPCPTPSMAEWGSSTKLFRPSESQWYRRAEASHRCQLGVLQSLGPDGIARELSALASRVERAITPTIPAQLPLPHLIMPAHHDVRTSDVLTPRLYANLAAAADRAPIDFAELLLVPGI